MQTIFALFSASCRQEVENANWDWCMYNEQRHKGEVVSRTNEFCLVAEPVVVTIQGREVEISLDGAVALYAGLGEAITRVSEAEAQLKGDGISCNLPTIGKSGAGLSFAQTKLGGSKFIYIDGMPDDAMVASASQRQA